jgi:Inner membrane protein YgaP-like, transmembrane domain
MTIDRYLRMIAGAVVLTSLGLGYFVSPYWYLFTAFVGLNLFQSAFTNWCPVMSVLKALGVKSCVHELKQKQASSQMHPAA